MRIYLQPMHEELPASFLFEHLQSKVSNGMTLDQEQQRVTLGPATLQPLGSSV